MTLAVFLIPLDESFVGCDIHVQAILAKLLPLGIAKVLDESLDSRDEAFEGVVSAESVKASQEVWCAFVGVPEEIGLITPKHIGDDVKRKKPEPNDTINIFSALSMLGKNLHKFQDMSVDILGQRVKVPVLEALQKIVASWCCRGIIQLAQGSYDAFPGAHVGVKACLHG